MNNLENREQLKTVFANLIKNEVATFNQSVSSENGDWVVKGFIDIAKNIYTISVDTPN